MREVRHVEFLVREWVWDGWVYLGLDLVDLSLVGCGCGWLSLVGFGWVGQVCSGLNGWGLVVLRQQRLRLERFVSTFPGELDRRTLEA